MDHLDEYMVAFHSIIFAIVRCLRIASTTAYLQEKFVNIGLMPDGGGTFWLPRLIGTARAVKAMLLSERIEAKELAQKRAPEFKGQ